MNYLDILQKQRLFFKSHKTKDLQFRKEQLKKLKSLIKDNEKLLYDAIFKDFGKSLIETFATEISIIYKEIDFFIKNLDSLSKPKKVSTNIINQLGSSKIYNEPLGNVLIIGAWNYPYQLILLPAISAIAAGNTCFLKPSEIPENTMNIMVKLINENFNSEFLFVVDGGKEQTTEILKLRFDKIFFTGSTKVGKIIYKAASENLTPVVLELGGKSPVFVTENANIDIAVRRIVWGKFINAGQTCIAPDYLYVHKNIKKEFNEKLILEIKNRNYSQNVEHYCQIINNTNVERLFKMIDKEKIIFGGDIDKEKRYISPTVLDNITWDDNVMQEEIFGPILPILSYNNLNDAIDRIIDEEKPLSAYIFSNNKEEQNIFIKKLSFGGGCINDCIMHFSNDKLPFGGVGNSGFGHYHGSFGFETFSHKKSILKKSTLIDPNFKYPPYSNFAKRILKQIL